MKTSGNAAKWPLCDLVRGGCVAGGDGAAEDAAVAERERRGRCAANGGYAALVPCATERSKGSATVNFMRKLEGQTPRKAHFSWVLRFSPRQRSRQHCQQLGDLLRVVGDVGSDAAAEAVDEGARVSN